MPLEAADIALAALAFLLAGVIKGTVGIGMPTASVGLMTQFLDPRTAIALVVFPSLLANLWQVYRTGGFAPALKRYAVFLATIMSVIWLVSATVTAAVPVGAILLALGVVVVLFSAASLAWTPPELPQRFDALGQAAAGVIAGVLGGLTAIWAPPMVVYLLARRVDKDEFVRATGLIIFLGTAPLILGLAQAGLITAETSLVSAAMTLPVLMGFTVGERLRRHLDTERFRKIVLVIFLVMGANLLRKALV
ncbi:MAG: sulfite exporter TauE/SafE family protein [Pseudomonadota bacterium]